ncbi:CHLORORESPIRATORY REDUCTION 23, NADH dehydrogenase-like complex L [Hibiscus trionum]|uniref:CHLORORESPIRATORY REDUCTION 23, NADH dehydrogenase-like complex L n=1 Tax=Hibiscus trionum TaxID=183268 RepID=A0A9W7HG74_HIBTR|nr:CHLORORESPIRATORY REDUCTION 23, NADH dehydrogenase-like complex L [Hibiscus trionum]
MLSSFSFQIPKALPSIYLSPSHSRPSAFFNITSQYKPTNNPKLHKEPNVTNIKLKPDDCFDAKKTSLAIPVAALLSTFGQPALAVTGVNNEPDLITVIIQLGIIAFFYFLIVPPIIMNWLRIRWYRRNLLEMYLQFMFVFLFFPGVLLWAPFLNFRKFPRDPSLKYPWDTPKDPSQVKNSYAKYPYAKPEDYDW